MSEQVSARATQEPKPAKWDGKQRIYLIVTGAEDACMRYLERYPDDPPDAEEVTIRKVSEIRLDRLNDTHIVIPVVRNINADRRVEALIPSKYEGVPPSLTHVEEHGEVRECSPVPVAKFYKRARGRDAQDEFRENDFVNAIGAVCMPAAPRVQRTGNNQDGHVRFLVLRWG